MDSVKIISDNGLEINVNGIFYIFNSKYYFMYTLGETVDNDYIRLYVVQVCKEIQNTPSGPLDTGYMLGMKISDNEEWVKVQQSITKIVENKKNGTQNPEIQYLPISMLVNLKIINENKFKLMKRIVEDDFKVILPNNEVVQTQNVNIDNVNPINLEIQPVEPIIPLDPTIPAEPINPSVAETYVEQPTPSDPINQVQSTDDIGEVIIDYRSRFFEEQEKNESLEAEIKILKEKLENIKNIVE